MDYFTSNRLLRVLSPSDQRALRPALSMVELRRGQVLGLAAPRQIKLSFLKPDWLP